MEALQKILADDSLDLEDAEESKCEKIEELIRHYGWKSIESCLLQVLEADSLRCKDWNTAAEVFWGAVLDERDLSADRVIALLYQRLPGDEYSANLAWSIASKLKGVGYLSDYDPLADPGVQAELDRLRKDV